MLGAAVGIVAAPMPAVAQAVTLEEIQVVAPSPLPGGGIERDKVPALVQTLGADDFARNYSPSVTDAIGQRIPGVTLTDVQGNGFTQDLEYRGFSASPVQGTPQGIAVYQNGVRINEAFGDTVNWDLIPPQAIERADIWSNNPVFGLNALGGAVSLQMKNGFTYSGVGAEVQGGSFGRIAGALQYGAHKDNFGVYVAADGLRDDGWRLHSPAQLARFYGDIGWKSDKAELHLIGSAASNFFGVVGPTPVELLQQDRRAIYTFPQTTRNEAGLLALNGKFALPEGWLLQTNVYARKFQQQHVDGNAADVERCSRSSSFPTSLCLQDDAFPRPSPITTAFRNQFVILNPANTPVPFTAGVSYGSIDRTNTDALTLGGSVQATNTTAVFGHGNHFTVGASVDRSQVAFGATSELGVINPDLSVTPSGAVPGTGQIIHTLANIGYAPVSLDARSTYYGLYVTDTFDITQQLSVTAGARLNVAQIGLRDLLGTSPDLNGDHRFSRINPVVGLTYRIVPGATFYAGYSESNRAPTPLELGCANRDRPCLLEGFVVSDPPLKQVVSKTYELGLRGNFAAGSGRLDWKAGLFRTDAFDDILPLSSTIPGRGYFQNVPGTRRQGIEAGVQYQSAQWLAYANYSFLDATYRFEADLPSPHNPLADADGNVHVVPGTRIPVLPRHQFKAGAEYAVTPEWRVGADLLAVGSRTFFGDHTNQNEKLPPYVVVNVRTSYQLTKEVQIFGLVNNLFNERYATYGRYYDTAALANAITTVLSDPRMITPGQPLSIYAGLRVKL
ncbi:MAG TPA: TonB-dependent receptor [Xanthobacteraceae bacterium]